MKRIVVFRHGIGLNRWFMAPMERHFRRLGFEVHNRGYPSTRKLVEEHAVDLAEELKRIADKEARTGEPFEIHAITHSMGGLVLRWALTHFDLPPVRRAVLMVPPNRGSTTARYFRDFGPFRWIFGTKAALQLAADPPAIYEAAGIPTGVEIGILAGDLPLGIHPLRLKTPHDGVVSVEESSLPPYPMKVLRASHTMMLFSRRAWDEAAWFLENGRFRET